VVDGVGDEGDGDSSDHDEGLAQLPAFDPTRLQRAANAAASAPADEGDEQQHGRQRDAKGRRQHHSNSSSRGRGRGRNSLAAVRKRGGGGGGPRANMFEVEDGPFRTPRRKGMGAGKSCTFR
jgi:hypothetical protein